ncbi:MAG: transglycosylase SLT domain-containing protein [Chitinispirillaceae bacterium]|nr:transglycosylase SLT domain-containing protein [Chitinispirillaceae bacterium]
MRMKTLPVIIAITFCAGITGNSEMQRELFGIDWTGTAALRQGDYSTALQQILIEPVVEDTLFRDFKLAVIYYRLHNYSTALSLLQGIIERQPACAPIVFVYIAEIERELGRPGNTLAAYRSVLRDEISQRYRHYIYEKLRAVVEADTTITMEQAPWLEEYYRWRAPLQEAEVLSNIDTIEGYIDDAKWSSVDSVIVNYTPAGKDACRIVKSIRAALDENAISLNTLFWCARTARSCRELTLARQFLDHIEKRPGYSDSLPARQYRLFLAQLSYDLREWNESIREYKRYLNLYGQDPDVLMAIARAYRKLNKKKESADWYDRVLKAFPRSPKTQEIIWLRAWNYEDARRFDLAGKQYRLIYTKYSKGIRTDESYVRHALCFFKRKKYDAARIVLDTFVNKLQDSPLVLAGYFWQAKCYLAMDKKDDAFTILRLVSRKEPFDYYAHRSRQLLLELGETTEVLIDTNCSGAGVLTWFDSISQSFSEKKEISSADSIALLNGLYLASIGDLEKADFFLEPLELGSPRNLSLQYKLALLYLHVGATPEAFRIARRLTWRIPPEFRVEMPLDVYCLFYPPFYADRIINEAKQYDLDPFLISGLIRQESTFNPEIVSPAGAVGLMQIMPYTGKYIAEKKGKDFSADSLYMPYYNIHFGVFYLHELQQEFDSNSVLTLAAYNAGPHNAKKWKEQNKNDEFDLFVENIGFTETRNYVKKVMGNYWTYRFLSSNPSYVYGSK